MVPSLTVRQSVEGRWQRLSVAGWVEAIFNDKNVVPNFSYCQHVRLDNAQAMAFLIETFPWIWHSIPKIFMEQVEKKIDNCAKSFYIQQR